MPDRANPKDLLGIKKVPMWIVPPVATMWCAMSFLEGAMKYGPFNWRSTNVRASIYIDAISRHLAAYLDGENRAPDSGVLHLGHIMACCGILIDAASSGNLVDDRPVAGKASQLMNELKNHPLIERLAKEGYKKVE